MAKQTVCIQYYDSPCGRIVLASVGDALCLCDWQGMPCAERNRRRLERFFEAEFVEKPSAIMERAKKEFAYRFRRRH